MQEIKFKAHHADSFTSANGVTQPKGTLKTENIRRSENELPSNFQTRSKLINKNKPNEMWKCSIATHVMNSPANKMVRSNKILPFNAVMDVISCMPAVGMGTSDENSKT